ncbi:expressed unknown protein [Seminavis robusta]|uniref:Uncharacterized protein n=1 Tax=Seminavis robusta TaxID=568900 RepID=A0A9N8EWZ3_9STRA|nr:expressed unknown protein [Seminavis robusta]|eukprot:Sro2594_g332110.1 n/a (80) ;mRNA; r:4839-5078
MVAIPVLFACIFVTVILVALVCICRAKAYENKGNKEAEEDGLRRVYAGRDWCGSRRDLEADDGSDEDEKVKPEEEKGSN